MFGLFRRGARKDAIAPGQITDGIDGEGRYWGRGAFRTMSGQPVTAETALQLDVVQAVLEVLSNTISTLPMMVYERTSDDEQKPAQNHPLYKLLHDRPNARQTAQEFRDEQQRHLSFWRNCYAKILPGPNGAVGSLEPIHPSLLVEVWRDASSGRVFYKFRNLLTLGTDVFRDDEIWHIRKAPLTVDGLLGRPMWETARETFGRAQAVEQFGALFFANGGSGGGVLQHPGAFKDKGEQENFLEAWRDGGTGLNRHRDRLLLNGVTYTPFSVNNDEAQFLETLKEVGLKLCRLWNMPPHRVGMLDRATFSNIEQQSIDYVIHTLAPWVNAWEQAACRDLLIGDDQDRYFVEFNLAGLLRGDLATRWKAYGLGRQWGWLSVNDIRRMENQPSIGPDGDRYLEPTNMNPAGKPQQDETATAPGQPGQGGPPQAPQLDPDDAEPGGDGQGDDDK